MSPPCTPRYNGSVEAGAGTLKTRIIYHAAKHGMLGAWTSDDVEAARLQGNCATWPWGSCGLTPQETWEHRSPITPERRSEFRSTVAQKALELRQRFFLEGENLDPRPAAAIRRAAIRAALESLGLLTVRKRRVSPPFNSPLRDNIR